MIIILEGLAIGCVKKGYECKVEPDLPLIQGPDIIKNENLNPNTRPFTQIRPQEAMLAVNPNTPMSIDFDIQVMIYK